MKNLSSIFRNLFRAPVFEGEEDKTRTAALLFQILKVIWGLPVLLLGIIILSGRTEVSGAAVVISITLLTLMLLTRAGRVGLASMIMTGMIILIFVYADFQNAGNVQPSTLITAIAVIMSGLLLGRRAPVVTAILIAVIHAVIVLLQEQGLIVLKSAPAVGFENIVLTSIMILMIALLLQLAISRLQIALDEARQNQSELAAINRELDRSRISLESQVAERTRNLELAAEVGRSVSQVRSLDVMLTDAAELIRNQFNLYYVQVYLVNPSQTFLDLQAGTGLVGRELLSRNHRLALTTDSINGRAAVGKNSVVISDTAESPTFRPNPLLPETRSEMAVPLLVGGNVVGVLDMQSDRAGSLNPDNLSAFEALAGQLAIAIQNAKFLAETEGARAEVEKQARGLARSNWGAYLDGIHKPEETGFVFQQNQVLPMTADEQARPAAENTLAAPISVTGEALGNLVVEMAGGTQTGRTDELVNAVARQVAQQIESLRLLDNAERFRVEAEEASRRLTREGWKDYARANSEESLGYYYDLKEVMPYHENGNGSMHDSKNAVTLPVKVRDESVGRLSFQGIEPGDTDSLDLAKAVADRLGTHIESLRQFEQTQLTLAQSEKLFEASRRLTQSTDLQDLMKGAVETLSIQEIDRAILGAISYDSSGEMDGMTIVANWSSRTGPEATPVGTHYSKDALRAISLFTSPQPLYFNDMFNDDRVDEATLGIAKRLNYRAVAALPLFTGSRQDAILLMEAESSHNFTQDEIRLFSALSPQISTVVENRRQFERAQQQAERESTLNTISQKIQSATTVEAVLQIAARELGHALGAPMTVAQLSLKDK